MTRIQTAVLSATLLCATASGASLCFEAEHLNEMTYPFEIGEMKGTSVGLTLVIAEGAGSGNALKKESGIAAYRIPVSKEGLYSVWVRVKWNGGCSNSVFVQVGDGAKFKVASNIFHRWHWLHGGTAKLEKGIAQLKLYNREDGIWVDQIVLTTGDFDPSGGSQKANVIPGDPGKERLEPRLFVGSSGGSAESAPTDFKLSHHAFKTLPLEAIPRIVLRSNEEEPLVVWLRNNSLKEASGEVSLVTDAPLGIKPSKKVRFRIPAGVPLKRLSFDLVPEAGFARRSYRMFVRVVHGDGKVEGKRMYVVRPMQWLVTNDLPCPEARGIETPSKVDAMAADGFPRAVEGISWKTAPADAATPFGLLDMRKAVADKTYVMAYAYTAVEAEKEGDHHLDIRHDDDVRIWFNGKCVFTSIQSSPSASTRKLVKVRFKKGKNSILVKICQRKNFWEFGVNILDLDGKPASVCGAEVSQLLDEGKKGQ